MKSVLRVLVEVYSSDLPGLIQWARASKRSKGGQRYTLSKMSRQCSKSALATSLWTKKMDFTDEEIAALDEMDDTECSDSLWESARKHRKEAISLDEYCRPRKIDL